MSIFSLGSISDHINKKTVTLLVLQFVLIISLLGYKSYNDTDRGCVACHADKRKMQSLGYPQFYMTREMVEKESNHPNVKCHECHLGSGKATEAEKAHKGMLKAILINEAGDVLNRKEVAPAPLLPHGTDRIRELLPENTDVRNILWHDRNPETFNFDPDIAKKTCGKSDCHPQELKQFRKTIMATNFRQRTMRTWTEPYGPHNCGPSFADLPPIAYLERSGFDFKNTRDIVRNLNVAFSKDQAIAKQRFCNVCHAGCLDCHYAPSREKGVHNFLRRPTSESCAGNGRGTSICHPGAMQSRRGETYIGGDYSIPVGMEPDVHYKKNIHCVDCHLTGEKGMGDMQRKATCLGCHYSIEEAHKRGPHKNLDCAACHVRELRGYQVTIWGPGYVADKPNPFKKYSLYYGIQSPPIIIKDQRGIWMPVKVWPHSVGNIKEDVKSEGLKFRWPEGETRDAYYVIGTFDNLPSNNKHLLWLEIEQASHPFAKARDCDSCHKSERQVAISNWRFEDNQGAEPFEGTHKIVADKNSLRIEGLKNTTPIRVLEGANLEDFASWVYFKDKWVAPGNFSIETEKKKYLSSLKDYSDVEKRLRSIDNRLKESSKNCKIFRGIRGVDKKTLKRYWELKGALLHNYEDKRLLKEIEKVIIGQ